MVLGSYPQDGLELFAADMPEIQSGDLNTICQPLDYFGANIYWGSYLRAGGEQGFELADREPVARTDMDWPVTPEVLYWAPKFYYDRYRLPVVITECGMANADSLCDGVVDDWQRIEFLRGYLGAYGRAIEEGVPCLGYFLWSLMDNFEWAEGYSKRFGAIYVDYATQQRTLKNSAYWYSRAIAANEVESADDGAARASRAR